MPDVCEDQHPHCQNSVAQQVDSPQGLYNRPANTFVAGFIGSPAMNFLQGRLGRDAVEIGHYRIELPDALRRRLRDHSKEEVLVGLRPEAFDDAPAAASRGRTVIPADIEITEELGPETYAYFRVEGLQAVEIGERHVELAGAFTARLDPSTSAKAGMRLLLSVDANALHLFDPASGRSLLVA